MTVEYLHRTVGPNRAMRRAAAKFPPARRRHPTKGGRFAEVYPSANTPYVKPRPDMGGRALEAAA